MQSQLTGHQREARVKQSLDLGTEVGLALDPTHAKPSVSLPCTMNATLASMHCLGLQRTAQDRCRHPVASIRAWRHISSRGLRLISGSWYSCSASLRAREYRWKQTPGWHRPARPRRCFSFAFEIHVA